MENRSTLDHITIVLHQPRFPENIGATARAAWNMGLSRLVVVNPEDTDWERMCKLSTHAARELLEQMHRFETLSEALAPFQYIIGTTARLGGQRKSVVSPWEAAKTVHRLGRQNRIALLFGPEDRGLSNEELRFCHETVHIPSVDARSLNLAQAVLILCYEILLAHQNETDQSLAGGAPEVLRPDLEIVSLPARNTELPLATSFELEGMYQHLSEALQLMDFLDKQNPELWMMSLRRFFSRIGLYSNEVRMIRGVCRQLKWFITTYRPRKQGAPLSPASGKSQDNGHA